MKNLLTLLVLFLASNGVNAQQVYSVDYESQADVKVFVVDYESQADLLVYKVKYSSQAGDNDGNGSLLITKARQKSRSIS